MSLSVPCPSDIVYNRQFEIVTQYDPSEHGRICKNQIILGVF